MTTRPDIEAALARMGSKFGSKRELKALPDELLENESVRHIVSGTYSNGQGILVATDRRLLFIFRGITKQITEDFGYGRISSIEYEGGLLLASIKVYVSNQKAKIENLQKAEAKRIVDDVRSWMNQPKANDAPAPSQTSVHDELLKLKQLHDAGIIDDETYKEKSAPLIAQL